VGGIAVLVTGVLLGLWLSLLRYEVESRFRGELFDVPARVYTRPLVIERGSNVRTLRLVERLRRLGFQESKSGRLEPGEFRSGRGVLSFAPRRALGTGEREAAIELALDAAGRVRDLRDSAGQRLSEARVEPELLGELAGTRLERRRLVRLEDAPPHLVEAILTIEDRRFHEHNGLDVRRIAGAFVRNVQAGRVVQGGSTITQQLVKNLYLSPERKFNRKLREAVMAVFLELGHSKEEILEAYLNEVYLGQRGPVSIHGFGAAARHYFGKDLADVTLGEGALLAGLIAAPGRYSPFQHPEAARERRDLVLAELRETGKIDETEELRARGQPLEIVRFDHADDRPAPHFLAWLRAELERSYGEDAVLEAGLQVISTLDGQLQHAANRALAGGLARLEQDFPKLAKQAAALEGGLVALDPATGDVLALVGGRKFAKNQFDHATKARRQPGSAFKPIVALAALSRSAGPDEPLTLAARIEDAPLELDTPTGLWRPVNFDGEFRGNVSLRDALEQSLNVPIARVALEIGPERIVRTARLLGIESPLAAVPALALGASEVTLIELVRAYAAFPSGGVVPRVRSYREVLDRDGQRIEHTEADAIASFEAAETWLITSALQGAVERGTAAGLRRLGLRGPIAGKTGTTNDFRDAWFIGYTPSLVAGVWVGFDDATSVGVPASVAALPIFAEFVKQALGPELEEQFYEPPGIESVRVEPGTGRRAGLGCPGDYEDFLEGTAPTEVCEAEIFRVVRRPFDWLFGGRGRERRDAKPPPDRERRDWRFDARENREPDPGDRGRSWEERWNERDENEEWEDW
jgi:penicillin-binding protein 1B